MKITDKIVTQIEQPSMTNVVWHNPDTNELKIYGKTGWEVVGGSPGGSNVTPAQNGYPIVNTSINSYIKIDGAWEPHGVIIINAKPNTSYNIPDGTDQQIQIAFNPFQLAGVSGKYLMCSFDDLEDGSLSDLIMLSSYLGFIQTENTDYSTKEQYPYKLVNPCLGNLYVSLVSSDITTSISTTLLVPALSDTPIPINNIKVKEANEYYLIMGIPTILKEVENDNNEYQHKYVITDSYVNMSLQMDSIDVYTYEENGETFIVGTLDGMLEQKIPVLKMNAEETVETTGEYIFNFKVPLDLQFSAEILWNNGNELDVSQPGSVTLSIVNGVACYTFVPE